MQMRKPDNSLSNSYRSGYSTHIHTYKVTNTLLKYFKLVLIFNPKSKFKQQGPMFPVFSVRIYMDQKRNIHKNQNCIKDYLSFLFVLYFVFCILSPLSLDLPLKCKVHLSG